MRELLSATRRHSPMTTCGGTPSTLGSTSHGSTATGPQPGRVDVSAGTRKAEWRRVRCEEPQPCSSTLRCTVEPTTRLPCLRRWPDGRYLLAPRPHQARAAALGGSRRAPAGPVGG